MRIHIDGAAHTGNYRCACDCLTQWQGHGQPAIGGKFSPALPIVEAVMHHKLEHTAYVLDLQFSPRFVAWVTDFWALTSGAQMAAALRQTGQ